MLSLVKKDIFIREEFLIPFRVEEKLLVLVGEVHFFCAYLRLPIFSFFDSHYIQFILFLWFNSNLSPMNNCCIPWLLNSIFLSWCGGKLNRATLDLRMSRDSVRAHSHSHCFLLDQAKRSLWSWRHFSTQWSIGNFSLCVDVYKRERIRGLIESHHDQGHALLYGTFTSI